MCKLGQTISVKAVIGCTRLSHSQLLQLALELGKGLSLLWTKGSN